MGWTEEDFKMTLLLEESSGFFGSYLNFLQALDKLLINNFFPNQNFYGIKKMQLP